MIQSFPFHGRKLAVTIKVIEDLDKKTTELILSSKSESLRWVIGALFANTGLIVTLLKLLG